MGNIASLTVIRLVQQIKRLLAFSSLHCYLDASWLLSVPRILYNGFKQRLRPRLNFPLCYKKFSTWSQAARCLASKNGFALLIEPTTRIVTSLHRLPRHIVSLCFGIILRIHQPREVIREVSSTVSQPHAVCQLVCLFPQNSSMDRGI